MRRYITTKKKKKNQKEIHINVFIYLFISVSVCCLNIGKFFFFIIISFHKLLMIGKSFLIHNLACYNYCINIFTHRLLIH